MSDELPSKKDHHMEEGDDIICPICLSSSNEVLDSVVFCKSPCGHIFCVPCLEHFLLKPKSNDRDMLFGDDDSYYYKQRPNTGNCPLCRRSVNLFDLINIQCGSQVYSKNSTIQTWPICDRKYSRQPIKQLSSSLRNEQSVLNRLMETKGVISGYGLEFDFNSKPGIRFSSTNPPETSSDQELSDPPLEFHPLTAFHFFTKTMTFQGNVQFPTFVTRPKDYRYDKLEVLLQFNENGHFVRDGYLRWHLQSTTAATTTETSHDSDSSTTSEHYPLDGTWQVTWASGQSVKINVQRHCFDCFQYWYEIELDENHCPKFSWPSGLEADDVVQTSDQSLPPGNRGPLVGETLTWKTNSSMSEHSSIVWKRLETDLADAWKLIRIKPNRFPFKRVRENGEEDDDTLLNRPTYHSDQLWGNTFCQAFCVGLASYHFVRPSDDENDEPEAYISYEHPRTSTWPPLDNGSAVPSRVPFRNASFDAETRTFRGDICWLDDYGTRWQGEAKWSYEIQFDPLFLFVEGGTCRMDGRSNMRFGLDLIYVNAAIEDPIRESIQGNDNNVSYESASDDTKNYIRHLMAALVQSPESSLIDFNI